MAMIKTILVCAKGTDRDGASLAAAMAVARPFNAHLDALHVRLDPVVVLTHKAGPFGMRIFRAS
jgi:hypothetical protein